MTSFVDIQTRNAARTESIENNSPMNYITIAIKEKREKRLTSELLAGIPDLDLHSRTVYTRHSCFSFEATRLPFTPLVMPQGTLSGIDALRGSNEQDLPFMQRFSPATAKTCGRSLAQSTPIMLASL